MELEAAKRGGRGRAADEARPGPALERVEGREAFLKLRTEWDAALLAGPDAAPSLEHEFLRLWIENFAPSLAPVVHIARVGRKIAAALPVLVRSELLDGVPLRLATTPVNAHSTRGGLLVGPGGLATIPWLIEAACDDSWDVLTMRDVPREAGVLEALAAALREVGCHVATEAPMESPYITLPASWEELEARLDGRFRQNLRRRRRRLEEQGPVTFEVIDGLDGLDAALEDALAIEASGWKGLEGSAIRARPDTVGFYAGAARALARAGRLRLAFLKLGDERIAFQLAHVTRGRWYLPKTGFDERFREQSPGQLLMVEVLRRCLAEKLETFEFLGFSMPWKRDWTPLVRPHATLYAYRPTWRGRAARVMRAEVRPRFAQLLRRGREVLAVLQARRRGGAK